MLITELDGYCEYSKEVRSKNAYLYILIVS
ncbi:uncharacterized protein METZ01_LOCUS112715 [marine metagenome]|uniref:Uncharacterized protein n=1 Tax=marine metagenome TaxID=408172 RepID=A0A381X5U3_9ZZZZ